jgi:predicted dienelactone hydrolase
MGFCAQWGWIVLLAGVSGCKGDSQEDTGETGVDLNLDPAGDYTRLGPFTVGYEVGEVVATGGYTLGLSLWFPSEDSGVDLAHYGSTAWLNQGESYFGLQVACEQTRPVMLHSHGNGSLPWEVFYLSEFLASHGWVVVAPGHTGNTLFDFTEDFEVLRDRRPSDIQNSFDWLVEQSQDPTSRFFGCVNEKAGYFTSGYSFGGYTAYANGGARLNDSQGGATIYLGDPRVRGVVALAPWNAEGALSTGMAQISVPVLSIGGERDATVGQQYKALHGGIESTPKLMGSFPNAGHYSYTPIYCTGSGDGCGSDFVDQDWFVESMKTSVLSWVEHVRGRPGALEQLPAESAELSWTLVD